MVSETLFRNYCDRHGLIVVDVRTDPDFAEEREEEWPDVTLAAFQGDSAYRACVAVLKTDGTCRVVTKFADGDTLMEDRWAQVTAVDMLFPRPLHAKLDE